MKLSEAIREGAKITKPQIGRYSYLGHDGLRCCALGAAACFILDGEMPPDNSYAITRILNEAGMEMWKPVDNPAFSEEEQTPLKYMIQDLNDVHGWTREQIADWLESINL